MIRSPYAHDNSAKEPLEPAAAPPAPEAKRHDDNKEKDGKKNVEKKNDDRSPLVIKLICITYLVFTMRFLIVNIPCFFCKITPGEPTAPKPPGATAAGPLNLDAACAVAKGSSVPAAFAHGPPLPMPAEEIPFVRGVSMDGVRMFLNFMQQAGHPPPPMRPMLEPSHFSIIILCFVF